MKTKFEIIEETANFYNSYNRGYQDKYCAYYSFNTGRQCAVGRCLGDSKSFQEQYGGDDTIDSIIRDNDLNLDDYLKEEYRGHDIKFWFDLQLFHDTEGNWDVYGLSERGIQNKKNLIINYK